MNATRYDDTRRVGLLDAMAAEIPTTAGRCCLVGVDGPDGSGKSTFADGLHEAVRRRNRPAVRVSCDDFHNVAAVRYRRGRTSPEGFWLDSFDYDRFIADVVAPLRTPGTTRFRAVALDVESDRYVAAPWTVVTPASVIVVDGLFLHRDELAWAWDLSVFLDVGFDVTAARMAERNGTEPDPRHPAMRRYVEGQQLYFAACRPQAQATFLIDNTDYDKPALVRGPRLLS